MVPDYNRHTLSARPTGTEVARFVVALNGLRQTVDVSSLTVTRLDIQYGVPAASTDDDPRPYMLITTELTGHLMIESPSRPDRAFRAWATYRRYPRTEGHPHRLQFMELIIGVVSINPQHAYQGEVIDVTTDTLVDDPDRPTVLAVIPGFPSDWWWLLQRHIHAEVLDSMYTPSATA